jgi:hypothetical protein
MKKKYKKKNLEALLTFCMAVSWVEESCRGYLSRPPIQAGIVEGPSSGEAGAWPCTMSFSRGRMSSHRDEAGAWEEFP